MFRVYYLVNSIDQVKTALKNIEQSELGTNRVHVMARDNGELSREGIHATTPWEDTNIMTTGFYGAVVGAVIGLLVGWALSGIDPWGLEIGFWGVMVSVLFFGSHGAWAGGIRGISLLELPPQALPGRYPQGALSDHRGCGPRGAAQESAPPA